jgi:hypothetical protein
VQDYLAAGCIDAGKPDVALFDRVESDRRVVLPEKYLTASQAAFDRERPYGGGKPRPFGRIWCLRPSLA